jgi:hypothetical protein
MGLAPVIARHSVNEEGIKKRVQYLDEDLPDSVLAARKNLIRCNALKLHAWAHAAQLLVLTPASPTVCRLLRLGAESVVAIFQGALADTDEIEVRLGEGPPARVRAAVTPDLHDVGNWTDGFFMAAISRDRELIEALCGVPMKLLRASTTRGLEDAYLFAEALQLHSKGQGDPRKPASAALLATEAADLPRPAVKATRELANPSIQVFLRLLEKEGGRFNETLAQALELHRRFWSRNEDVARDPAGYFSLPLTGLGALAHDAGIAITVESDYLPIGLVRGDCRPSA